KDGLVNSRVRKAYQDSKGIMYFMTFGGLSVYDGARFTNYTAQNGLAADMINDIIEMGDDSVWIACNTGELNYLRHGKIRLFKTTDGFCPTINKLIRCKNGAIYVVADEGLFRFQHNRFIRLPFFNRRGDDAGKFIVEAVEWNDFLLLLSDNSLSSLGPGNFYVFNKKTEKLDTESEGGYISALSLSPDNQIYIIQAPGVVQMIDTKALLSQQVRFLPPPAPYKNLAPEINYIYFDSKKNCWLVLQHKKIIKIDSAGSKKDFSMENGLSSNDFSDVFVDREGSAWITMHSPGVDKLVNDNIEQYDKFSNSLVNALYTNERTDTVFLHSVPGKKIFIVHPGGITGLQLPPALAVPAGLLVSSGRIYLANGRKIVTMDDDQKKKARLLYLDTGQLFVGNLYTDPYQNLLSTGSSYLTVFRNDTLICRYPISYSIDQVAFDNKNRLWVASRGNEFYVLEIQPGKQKEYLRLLKKYDKGRPYLSARSLTTDHFNNVWVGTRTNGLYCFRFDEQLNILSFQQFTIGDGLSDNFITHLNCDRENNIWVSTSSGIDKITYSGNKINIESITRSNNIYEYIVKTLVNKEGVAWSYTADGNLIKIGKDNRTRSFTPSLLITTLKIGNTPADSLARKASFSHKQNSLSISVAAPSFYDERQIKYSYLLQGSGNDQWSDPSTTSIFNFINLNPGKYVLQIKALFPGNRYPDKTIDYAFEIHPPWWQTLLFRLITASLVMSLLIIASRLYYRRKLAKQRIAAEKQQAVEKERTRIATDIHDDLGSGLSRIRYLGEMVKLKSSQQQNILPDIEKISAFSDEMVDKMNEIVWALNEKNDSLDSIISYTRSFAVDYLSNNDLLCKVNLPDEIPHHIIKGETRRNIYLSVKECLHNIVKHAEATEVHITISLHNHVDILIHDNGKGIDWENLRPFSNGMMNIRKRMRDAGGSVDFRNEDGTIVALSIPL
ncbi:MAG: two-component regulator propeller domain-containing protein, partial [Chitinophagales bacterium]